MQFFATCPKGIESLLTAELLTLGASEIKETRAGVTFQAELKTAYRMCLWSRLANKILLVLNTHTVTDWDSIYQAAYAFPWHEHMTSNNTFALTVDLINAPVTNSQYAMQRFKDGLVDAWRDKTGTRPNVSLYQPDLHFQILIKHNTLTIHLNLSGDSLHRRGYRLEGGSAPLKENLAAALLLRADWPSIAKQGGSLFDPLCGSGTLLTEAALIAGDIAPGLLRSTFGFFKWQEFMPTTWKKLIAEAELRRAEGITHIPKIIGYDASRQSIRLAQTIIERAQLNPFIHLECKELATCRALSVKPGLVITNPPYGERLGEKESLTFTYQHLGTLFKEHFSDWRCSVFTGNPDLAKALKLGPESIYRFFNGPIPCQLLNFIIRKPHASKEAKILPDPATASIARDPETPGLDFINRLEKNWRKLHSIAEKNHVSCYRLYDADLPDYAVAIDLYQNFIHVQEYAAPKTIDPEKAAKRLDVALHHVHHFFQISAEHIFLKTRRQQKGLNQYQKQASTGQFHTIQEGPAKFLVNFTDYLDTGLFLDSRLIRQWIFAQAKGKHFLNLFCYTGSATVYAALAKAASTTSIDLSATYLEWAKRNVALNGLAPHTHQFIQADCLQWLSEERKKFDLILLDPPTFSNSKRMDQTLDIQRDQVTLIQSAMQHLTRDGTLIFVTNKRQFKLAPELKETFQITDFSKKTLPFDFQRYPIHQAYLIQHIRHTAPHQNKTDSLT